MKKTIKNIAYVLFSNLIVLMSSILAGFIIPKIFSIDSYGYYKYYTLYLMYFNIMHFGFSDGIYLKFAGKSYEELDKQKFRTYTKFLLFFEIIITLIVVIISMSFMNKEYRYIFILLALNLVAIHLTSYFQFISQIVGKFGQLSIRNIIKSVLLIFLVIAMYLVIKYDIFSCKEYRVYLIGILIVNYLIVIWYFITYKDITFGKANKFGQEKKEIFNLFKIGFPLLIANMIGSLILNMDRQFVSILYDIETYSIYAFAYNLLSIVTTIVSAVSLVVYPTMKNSDKEKVNKNYKNLMIFISCFCFFCLLAYFPLYKIIDIFLFKYHDSLKYFRIIFPGLALSASITVIIHNYFKFYEKNMLFFFIGLGILILSILFNFLAYFIVGTPISISMVSIASTLIWFIIVDIYIQKKSNSRCYKKYIYIVLLTVAFYVLTYFNNIWYGFIYLFCYIVITTVLFYKEIKYFLFVTFKKNKKNFIPSEEIVEKESVKDLE